MLPRVRISVLFVVVILSALSSLAQAVTVSATSSSGNYSVSWSVPPGFYNLMLWESDNNGASWSLILNPGAVSGTHPIVNKPTGTYKYKLEAKFDAYGDTHDYVDEVQPTVTVVNPNSIPNAPVLSASPLENTGNFTVSWVSGGGFATTTYYQLFMNGVQQSLANPLDTSKSYSLGVEEYKFKAKACNGYGCSASFSNEVTVKVLPTGNITATSYSTTGDITVSWNLGISNVTVTIIESINGGGTYTNVVHGPVMYQGSGSIPLSRTNGTYKYKLNFVVHLPSGDWETHSYLQSGTTTVNIPAPDKPTGGQVTPAISTNGSHTASWIAPPGLVSHYFLKQNGGTSQQVNTTSKNYPALPNGTYSYTVQACNSSGCGSWSDSFSGQVKIMPNIPTGLTAVPNSEGGHLVSWNAPPQAVTSYDVEQNGAATNILSPTRQKDYNNLSAGSYSYRVRACYQDVCSLYSSPVGVQIDIPAGFSVQPYSTDGNIDISWNFGPLSQVMAVSIFESRDGGSTWLQTPVHYANAAQGSTTLTNRPNGTYKYRFHGYVTGLPAGEDATLDEYQNGVTTVNNPNSVPGVPSISVTPLFSHNGAHTASWQPALNSAAITYFQLYLDGFEQTLETPLDQSKAYGGGIGVGQHAFTVVACNTHGCGDPSAPAEFEVLSTSLISATPSSTDGEIEIGWDIGYGTAYSLIVVIYQSTDGWHNQSVVDVFTTPSGNTTILRPNGTYQYRLEYQGYSPPDEPFQGASIQDGFTVVDIKIPDIPELNPITAVPGQPGRYLVSWNAVAEPVSKYLLKEIKPNNDGLIHQFDPTETSYTTDVLTAEGIYRYSIKAVNGLVSSEFSAEKEVLVSSAPGVVPPLEFETHNLDKTTVMPYLTSVSPSGSARITVPIEVAPGVNSMTPRLSLDYSSGKPSRNKEQQIAEDTLGYGWGLTRSSIRRCLNGTNYTAVSFSTDGSICWDGQLLRHLGNNVDVENPGAQYRTHAESFTRIETKDEGGQIWFEVKTPDGRTLEYGRTADSRVRATNLVGQPMYEWSLSKETDAFGNTIVYNYHLSAQAGINYLQSIVYGNNGDSVVEFGYDLRLDSYEQQIGDENQGPVYYETVITGRYLLLHSIVVKHNGDTVRDYRLGSSPSNDYYPGQRRLNRIQQCGYDENGSLERCLEPLNFEWVSAPNALPGFETSIAQVIDGLGRVTQFNYGLIKKGEATNLFNETPFGAPALPGAPYNAVQSLGWMETLGAHAQTGDTLRSVVNSMKRSNGLGGMNETTYAYQGEGLRNKYGWGFIGFYAQRIRDEQSQITTYVQQRIEHPFLYGKVAAVHQYDDFYGSHGQILSKVENQYSQLTLPYIGPPLSVSTDYRYLSRSTEFMYEGGTLIGVSERSVTPTLTANLLTSLEQTTKVAKNLTVAAAPAFWGDVAGYNLTDVLRTQTGTTNFTNRTSGQWLLGFVNSLSIGTVAGSNPEIIRDASFEPHGSTNKVQSMTAFPGSSSLGLVTNYTIDLVGNVTHTAIGNIATAGTADQVESRSSGASNYADGRYPTTLTNALSHATTLDYDLRFGLAKQATDPNGRLTRMTYDAFGRVTSITGGTTSVDEVTTSITYSDCDACAVVDGFSEAEGASSSYSVTTSSAITPTQIQYFDVLGRVIRTETEAFEAGTIARDVYYDDRGRVQAYTLPYFKGVGTPSFVKHEYDIRNRVTREIRPDAGETEIARTVNGTDGVSVTVKEKVKTSLGFDYRVKSSNYNQLGQLISTQDFLDVSNPAAPADPVTTDYSYDSVGNITTVTVAGTGVTSTTRTFQYDLAGNQIQANDPDAGLITNKYNIYGELKEQINNRGAVTHGKATFQYDRLGRITQRSDGKTHTYEYDAAGGIGMLSRIDLHGNFDLVDYSYSQGRLTSKTNTTYSQGAGTRVMTTSFAYDVYGRTDSITYPDGFKVRQEYNPRGYLSGLRSDAANDLLPGQLLESYGATDAFGNITEETYANGLSTTRVYDPLSGRLTHINTGIGLSGTGIQNQDYAWRSNGILESRDNLLLGATESFQYDALDRLTQASTALSGGGTRALNYQYNRLGNLTSKTSTVGADDQVSGYVYGSGVNDGGVALADRAGPHAVKQAVINGQTHNLKYDKNGALIKYDAPTGPDRFIEYNFANQPLKIVLGSSLADTNPVVRELFTYTPEGERIARSSRYYDDEGTTNNDILTEHHFYSGAYEEVRVVQATYTKRVVKRVWVSPNVMVVRLGRINQWGGLTWENRAEFLHRDHQGSVDKITDISGNLLHTLAFDPYGSRRKADWTGKNTAFPMFNPDLESLTQELGIQVARGYTGHEHLDRTGLIHMNGRIYDPQLGRFLSPDPIVQAPSYSQSWNRYSYTFNSPLSYTDPSGYESEEPAPIEKIIANGYRLAGDYDELELFYVFSQLNFLLGSNRGMNSVGYVRSVNDIVSETAALMVAIAWVSVVDDAEQVERTKEGASLVADFLPVVGALKSLWQAVTGKDAVTGKSVDRKLEAAGIILGMIPGGKLLTKGKRAGEFVGDGARGGTETVQRAMSRAELENIQRTGLLSRGGRPGDFFVSPSVNSNANRARQRLALPNQPEVRVTLEVPSGVFSQPTRVRPLRLEGGSTLPGGGLERVAPGSSDIPVRIIRVNDF